MRGFCPHRARSPYQSGFSLVELSIVLVLIGLILAAVSFAGNLHRSSQSQMVKQKFIDQWVSAYNDYYTRTGLVPGDSSLSPTFAVNAQADPEILEDLLESANGVVERSPPRLCEGIGNDDYAGASGETPRSSDATSLRQLFLAQGVRLPPGRAPGQEDRLAYLDSNGNPQELQVCFQWNPPDTVSGSGNVMVIKGLTPDLARTLDRMIDGQVNAMAGAFREQGRLGSSDCGNVGSEWCLDNRYNRSGVLNNRDEDQVATVTAHYRMNQ